MPTSLVKVGFIGGGNMAEALIKGLLDCGMPAQDIWVADPSAERQVLLRETYRVQVTTENLAVVDACRTVVLAIKPQMVGTVVPALAEGFTPEHVLVSILAGTSTAKLEACLNDGARVVRVMPNTPALVGAGVAAISRGRFASDEDLRTAEKLLGAVGFACEVDEAEMDAVTGLSGSGPAYIFSVIEALIEGGVRQGLSLETARELATRTVIGAAQLVAETGEDPAVLRAKVCSPGGTTLAGLTALEEGDVQGAFVEAVARATKRSKELGQG